MATVPDKLTYEIEPGLLYGRPGPGKSMWNLESFRKAGVRVVVSLVDNPSLTEVRAAGLQHYVLPFEDKVLQPYRTANPQVLRILEEFDRILNTHLPKKEPVLVHCNSGKDRTGLVLAFYLITRRHWKAKRAITELRRLKPDALTANGFEGFVKALEPWMRELRDKGAS